MTHTTSTRLVPAAVLVALLLAGCGGGGGGGSLGGGNVAGTDVPTSATRSIQSLIAFMQSLIAGTSESSDPIVTGDAVLATSETDEPEPNP